MEMVTQTEVNITMEVVLIAPVGTLQHLPGKRPVQNAPLEKLEVPTKKVAPTVPWENIITYKVAPASLVPVVGLRKPQDKAHATNALQENYELLHQHVQVALEENTKMNLGKAAVKMVVTQGMRFKAPAPATFVPRVLYKSIVMCTALHAKPARTDSRLPLQEQLP